MWGDEEDEAINVSNDSAYNGDIEVESEVKIGMESTLNSFGI